MKWERELYKRRKDLADFFAWGLGLSFHFPKLITRERHPTAKSGAI